MDELFEANIWAWQFKPYETRGTGRILANVESKGLSNHKKGYSEATDQELPQVC